MKTYKRSLFIFRRDLRVEDNTALNAALKSSDEVVACFIFNDQQTTSHPYFSSNGLAFMIETLEELSKGIRLYFWHGPPETIIEKAIYDLKIESIFLNKDYTPFSRARDKKIFELCEEAGIAFHSFSDALLLEPSTFGKPTGGAYTVYTPFFKRALQDEIRRPEPMEKGTFFREKSPIPEVAPRDFWPSKTAPQRRSQGGRSQALEILERIRNFKEYKELRDFPAKDATTILSPHNKFGSVSIREVYWAVESALGKDHTLIRELFWRDFFTHIGWHFPRVFEGAFHAEYNAIEWTNDKEEFAKWCKGETGFPIIDAGMRELVATGYMHNRVRMIVASFLVKDLHIDWRWGEKFFAHHLTEFDPAVNNGSWQWAASTGCDAQPYFRIFNPWLQQAKFDPDCEYIKRWIPELSEMSPKQIHSLAEDPLFAPKGYPRPMVEHSLQKIKAEEMFRVLKDPVSRARA